MGHARQLRSICYGSCKRGQGLCYSGPIEHSHLLVTNLWRRRNGIANTPHFALRQAAGSHSLVSLIHFASVLPVSISISVANSSVISVILLLGSFRCYEDFLELLATFATSQPIPVTNSRAMCTGVTTGVFYCYLSLAVPIALSIDFNHRYLGYQY